MQEEELRAEIVQLEQMRKQLRQQVQDEKLATRTMPPLSQLTRVQKQTLLEPWYTVAAVVSAGIAAVSYTVAAIIWSWRWFWPGFMFTWIAILFICAKGWHQYENAKREGDLSVYRNDDARYDARF